MEGDRGGVSRSDCHLTKKREGILRSRAVRLWRRRVLPSDDANIVESGRERLTSDSSPDVGVSHDETSRAEDSKDGREWSGCSNVTSAISLAVAALDLGRADAAREELLRLLRRLWRIDEEG